MPSRDSGLYIQGLTIPDPEKPEPLFENLDLHVPRGQVLAILGRSGCGKTTLLNAIVGEVAVDGGSIEFDGEPIESAREDGRVSYQNQNPLLLPWLTVRQNCHLVREVSHRGADTVDETLIQLGLKAKLDRYPNTLSGGMYQRAAFGRAMSVNPHLLLIDEPFSALDEITRLAAYDILRRKVSEYDMSCLFVTHDVTEMLRVATRCWVIGGHPARPTLDFEIEEDVRSGKHGLAESEHRARIIEALL